MWYKFRRNSKNSTRLNRWHFSWIFSPILYHFEKFCMKERNSLTFLWIKRKIYAKESLVRFRLTIFASTTLTLTLNSLLISKIWLKNSINLMESMIYFHLKWILYFAFIVLESHKCIYNSFHNEMVDLGKTGFLRIIPLTGSGNMRGESGRVDRSAQLSDKAKARRHWSKS